MEQHLVHRNHLLPLEMEVLLLFQQLHQLVVEVVEEHLVHQIQVMNLEQMVDQEVVDQLLSHRQDPHPVGLEIHLQLVQHKVLLVVVDIIKVVYIMPVVVEVVQQQLELQVEMDLVQDLQEMVEQGQLLLLQEVLLEEQVEEMQVVVLLYEIRHQLVLVVVVMLEQEL